MPKCLLKDMNNGVYRIFLNILFVKKKDKDRDWLCGVAGFAAGCDAGIPCGSTGLCSVRLHVDVAGKVQDGPSAQVLDSLVGDQCGVSAPAFSLAMLWLLWPFE